MIDNGYLLGLYGGTSTGLGASSGLTAGTKKKQPTPPWDTKAVAPQADALVRAALGGRRLIDESAARVDLTTAGPDYRKLFALYQGLETLNALANRAAVKTISSSEQALLAKRFASGLTEIGSYLASAKLEDVRLVQGVTTSTSKSTAALVRDSAISLTAPIHEGSPDAEVAAFQGAVVFDIKVSRGTLGTTTVGVDLSEMGATPRTLGNVTSYINGKLQAAGLETRIGREQIKAEPRTLTVNGKTVTLPAGADRWALAVRGVSTEAVNFVPTETADAVYVTQAVGSGNQLLKFQADTGGTADAASARVGETFWVDGRASQTSLPEGVTAIRASATAPDGSVWIVADIDAGPGNQPIKGRQDVALMKYDPAGRLVWTRAVGAASTASGYAIAVDADGKVAVAGSVIGALEPGQSGDVATELNSFVTVFDAKGQELWTQRRGARAADEATSVSFGADGAVYVGGRAKSAIPGATTVGGWDGYVQGFKASQLYPGAPWTVSGVGVSQFGTAGEDSVQSVTVDGSNLYSAGVENGRLIVRRFTLDSNGAARSGGRSRRRRNRGWSHRR